MESEGNPTRSLGRTADLIARFARLLHESGAPSDRLEFALQNLARTLGVHGQFLSTPTSIMMSLRSGDTVETRLERLDPGELHLRRLSDLDQLLLEAGTSSDPAATTEARLERLEGTPPSLGKLLAFVGILLVTSSAAFLFGGGGADLALAAILGGVVHGISLLTARLEASHRLTELLGSFIVAAAATELVGRIPSLSPATVIVCALIPILPGLNFTVAIKEIASRHLVSGTSRLGGTTIVFLTLGIGSALGIRVGSSPEPETMRDPILWSLWAYGPALLATAFGFGILFCGQTRDLPWIGIGVALAVLGAKWLVPIMGSELGTWAAAFTVGLAGNLFARLARRPASVMQVPGLVVLVPGTLGVRSVAALSQENTLLGVQGAFSVLTVGIALAMGLLLASALLPARRPL